MKGRNGVDPEGKGFGEGLGLFEGEAVIKIKCMRRKSTINKKITSKNEKKFHFKEGTEMSITTN